MVDYTIFETIKRKLDRGNIYSLSKNGICAVRIRIGKSKLENIYSTSLNSITENEE